MSAPQLTRIKVENLGNLAIDPKKRLYWDNEKIVTDSVLGLADWQKNLITLFSFLAAVATIANAAASWTNYLTRKPPTEIKPVFNVPAPTPCSAPPAPASSTSPKRTH